MKPAAEHTRRPSLLRPHRAMGRRALAAWLLLLTYLLAAALPGSLWADPARARASAIVANRGQWDPRARYMADRGAMRIWFSAAGALYDLSDGGGHGHRVMQRFVDASAATPDASGVLPGGWSFIGAGGSAVTAPAFSEVRYAGIRPGIAARYYDSLGSFKYDLLVAPGGDPSALRIAYDGASSVTILPDGSLSIATSVGELREAPPVCYQQVGEERRPVACRFLRDARGVGFRLGAYDRSLPLVIDPVLVYSSYLGGARADAGEGIALDGSGNIYVTGETRSADFPTTLGAYDRTLDTQKGLADIFVAKLDPTGSTIIYATYIGGGDADVPSGIRVLRDGTAVVAGSTLSANLPTTDTSYQKDPNGGWDGFIVALNPAGSALSYSTYLGGPGDDYIEDLAIGNFNSIYVVGRTSRAGFPQSGFGLYKGGDDAFVARLDAGARRLRFSDIIGGIGDDRATGVVVEPGGAAWVTGWTTSVSDFPTRNALQLNNAGARDGFLLRVRVDGSTLDYGTLIGGSRDDSPAAIALDSAGNVYIAGGTASTDYPSAVGAPGSWFATKFLWQPSTLKALIGYSRYMGAVDNGGARTIQVDEGGSAYICGATDAAAGFPLAGEPIVSTPRGRLDIGFVRLDPAGSPLHASVLGGSRDDMPWHASYLSRFGDLFITGMTTSSDLPLSLGARDSILNIAKGDTVPEPASDAFVMRFNFQRRPAIFSQISYTLDTLRCADSATFSFRIHNLGDTDLVITGQFFAGSLFRLVPADGGDSTGVPRIVIPPGGSKPYKVLVPFAGDIQGAFTDYLTIVSNDSLAGRNPFIIRFSVVRARPVLTASPESSSVRLLACSADSLDFKVVIANKGVGDFTLEPIIFAAANGAFRVIDPKIPPGGRTIHDKSFTATLRFTPKRGSIGSDGIYRDTMVFVAAESKECGDTLRVPIDARVDSVSIVALDTAIHAGPLFACETSAERWVRVENNGTVPVSIDSATGAGFTVMTPLPHAVARGAIDSLRIVLIPPQSPGVHRSTLTLHLGTCNGTLSLPIEIRRLPEDLLAADLHGIDFGMIEGCAGREAGRDSVVTLTRDPALWDGDLTIFPPIGPDGFSLSGGPTAPAVMHAGDTLRLGVRYAPPLPSADTGTLLIPYQAGPCTDTLRIRLAGARADELLEVSPRDITLPDLVCDLARDTAVTVINRSSFPVTIAGYRATEGISRVGSHPLSPIAPGESFGVTLTVTPKRSGRFLDSLIFYGDPCGDSIVVAIRGDKEGAVIGFDRVGITFDPLLLCELPDTLAAGPQLRNTGSSGVATVRSARIIGSTSFALASDIVGREIGAGEVLDVPVAFAPASEGTFAGVVEVVVSPCNDGAHLDTLRLPLSGEVEHGAIAVSGGAFGSVDLGTSRRADLVVKNTSSTTLAIDTLANIVPPFVLVGSRPPLPAVLPPGDSAVVTLEFAPTVGGSYQPTLTVVTLAPCLDSTAAQLSGVAVATSSSAELCIAGRYAGISGDTIEIPLLSPSPGPIGGSTDITYTIGYDWRRLQLVGVVGDGVDLVSAPRPGDSIVLRQRGVADLRAEQLGLRFRLLTGGEGDVAVRLDSAVASSADLLLASCTDSAVVHISDRCVFTGVAPGKYHNALEDARPNPASTAVEVTYQQLEDARAVLRVFDAGGREVLRPLDADLPGGRYSIRFFVGDLPAGVYFYSLDAGSYHQSRKMVVER